jgi:hypothetical protein
MCGRAGVTYFLPIISFPQLENFLIGLFCSGQRAGTLRGRDRRACGAMGGSGQALIP